MSDHDNKGFSEEKCVRCSWVMGSPPLNCQNDNTPHVFPSQMNKTEMLSAVLACLRGIDVVLSTGKDLNEAECTLLRKGIYKALSGVDSEEFISG